MRVRTAPQLSRRSIIWFAVTTLLSASLLLLLFARLLTAGSALSAQPASPLVGHPAPAFAITTWNGTVGQRVDLSAYKGQPVLVNFWGSWCAECLEEQPVLQAAWQKYQTSGIHFIGIAFRDTQDAGTAYLQKEGVTYPSGPNISPSTPVDYAVTGAPETIFIDRAGIVVRKFIGPIDDGTLDRMLQALIRGQSVPTAGQ